ncbi:F-box family protein, partial [Trifolium medium]|nr:F-box family protein [Trifolium medium]
MGIKRAGSLFTFGCKAVSAKPVILGWVEVLFETVLPVPPGLSNFYTEMIKCQINVTCDWEGEGEDKFRVKFVYFTMKDMNEKP